MNLQDVEKRIAELDSQVSETKDVELVKQLTEEKRNLKERKQELLDIEERKANAEALNNGTLKPEKVVEREMKMTNLEVRNSLEYAQAFLKGFVGGDKDYKEARALLTENVSGSVPVPTVLEDEIKNAWESCELLNLAKQTTYKGNVKIGFEYSATPAVVHTEGTEAPAEETLVWGAVELKAETIKKWIKISDEAIANTTIDTLKEVMREVAHKIAEGAEADLIGKIVAAPATSSTTAPAVPVLTATTPAEDVIVMAEGLLSGQARNLHLVMNRQTKAYLQGIAMKAKYNVDIFDGLKDRIVYTDALKPFSTASSGDTYALVGDFGYGTQVNKPNGDEVRLIVDELSCAEEDLVKVVGKQLAGMGVVAPKAIAKIVK